MASELPFTNLDALWLANFADSFSPGNPEENHIHAQLLAIAGRLQRLDETNALLSQNTEYARGYAAAEAAMRRRSNILTNPEGEDAIGASILSDIERRVAEGRVRRIPQGERGLEDNPHLFNAPVRRKPKRAEPTLSLDLSSLDDL